jgi:Flp pilus assembly protein TadG
MAEQDAGKSARAVPARRRARQNGNAMLESALIFLPMIAMFFGIIDVSLAVFIQSTLNQATREAVRWAITMQTTDPYGDSCTSEAACMATVVQNNAIGVPGLTTSYIYVKYYTANDLDNPVMVCNNGSCSASSCTVSTCTLPQTLGSGVVVTTANQPGNIVEVDVTNFPWNWLVPLPNFQAGTGLNLSASAVDVLGDLAVGQVAPPAP